MAIWLPVVISPRLAGFSQDTSLAGTVLLGRPWTLE